MMRTGVEAIVLVNNTQVGGAERRFARVWTGLRRRGRSTTLIINRSLLDHLIRARVLSPADGPMVVLAEPFRVLANAFFGEINPPGVLARLTFWLGKLDYVLGGLTVAVWLLMNRPVLLHAVLGGAYLVWPSQVVGVAPPVVLSIVCPDLSEMVGAGIGEPLYRRALARAVTIDALTGPIRDGLVRSGTDPDRIRVSPGSFVDTDRFRGEAGKEPWVVFTGRLVEEKNPLLFVEACALVQARLKDQLPRLRFYLIGDGPLREQVEARIEKLGLAGSVETGWRDDVERVLAAAAVFVSLQRTDNYPSQALLEAMACECAAVATDVGQTERLVDVAVGRRVDATPTSVAEAVAQLLENPARTAQMGRQGRQRVMASHSTDAYLDYVEHLYTTVREGFGLEGVSPSNAECVTHHPSPITHHSSRS